MPLTTQERAKDSRVIGVVIVLSLLVIVISGAISLSLAFSSSGTVSRSTYDALDHDSQVFIKQVAREHHTDYLSVMEVVVDVCTATVSGVTKTRLTEEVLYNADATELLGGAGAQFAAGLHTLKTCDRLR